MIERDESNSVDDPATETAAEPTADAVPTEAEPAGDPASDTSRRAPDPVDERTADDPVQRLRAQLEEQSARLRAVSKAYTDLQQEMDGFRKRQQVLADARAERKAGEVVERFFEPVQNLKRAVDAGGSAEDLRGGVRLVLHQFARQLEELGLTEIPGRGAAFDPKLHDALALVPVPEPAQDGTVVEVYSTGWRIGDRVIQPAQVVVGKYEPPAAEA
jgi:molecular chaperone GrpE